MTSRADGRASGLAGVVLTRPGRRVPLTRCLASLAPCVDRVYVGVEAGAALPPLPANARVVAWPEGTRLNPALNGVLGMVEEPWTLRLDDDMWLEDNPRPDLDALIRTGASDVYALLLAGHRRVPGDPERGFLRFSYLPRLWRTEAFRYRGTLPRLARRSDGERPTDVPRSQIALHHDTAPKPIATIPAPIGEEREEAAFDDLLRRHAERLTEEMNSTVGATCAPTVFRLLHGAHLRRVALPAPFLDGVERCFGDKATVLWWLARYLHERRGETERAVNLLQTLLRRSAAEDPDFAHGVDPLLFGAHLHRRLADLGGPEDARLLAWADDLRPPTPSPLFTTLRDGDRLWITRHDYERLTRAVGADRPEGSHTLSMEESDRLAALLGAWLYALPDDPIPLNPHGDPPPYRIFGTAARMRRCAGELAEWLRGGEFAVRDEGPDSRYLALELVGGSAAWGLRPLDSERSLAEALAT